MVWVWPPHTSMNVYCRPGSHRAAIWAASAWAFSASRNSSTKRTLGLLPLVDLGQGEADVDQHPVARLQLLVLEQADVDRPADPAHVHLGQIGAIVHQLDDLTRDAQTHALPPGGWLPGSARHRRRSRG